MKKLAECKEYFKGLAKNRFSDDFPEEEAKFRFMGFCEALSIIYGEEFDSATRYKWTKEALNDR